jgi:hypothetical protein
MPQNGSRKVPDPNFPNWDLPLKWPYKPIPPIFFHLESTKIDETLYDDPIHIIVA